MTHNKREIITNYSLCFTFWGSIILLVLGEIFNFEIDSGTIGTEVLREQITGDVNKDIKEEDEDDSGRRGSRARIRCVGSRS